MDAKTPGWAVWTPHGLHNLAPLARAVAEQGAHVAPEKAPSKKDAEAGDRVYQIRK